ncbi:restriction endonuclease subunit S [Salarchaeum japonicum]|uniref:restriction endonuclease subunit S n=1 Tax=Salarchaeum japonicum TaxID=555573 RepID=UPI003C78C852
MSDVVETERESGTVARLGPRQVSIPDDWEAVPFEEAIDLNPSYDKPDEGTFDYLPMDAVDEEMQTIEYWTQREKDDCTTTWFKNGDTVYAKITPCTENGKIAFIDGLDTEVGSGSTEFLVFHPREGVTNERFVYYLANLPEFRSVTISLMEGSTGRQRVPSDVFSGGLEVPLPPLPEQRRIADILSTVDEQIQRTEEIIEETEELKQGLLQNLLRHGMGKSSIEERRIGPKEFTFPKNWRIEQVADLLSDETEGKPLRGGPPGGKIHKEDRSEGGYKLYTQEVVTKRDIDFGGEYITEDLFEELKSAEPKSGDILITRAGTVGEAIVFPEGAARGIIDSALMRLRLDKSICDPRFIALLIDESRVVKDQIEAMTQSGVVRNLNNRIIKQLQIPIPPKEEQERIISIISTTNEKREKERQTKQAYQELKRGLMQDLLTGKVRVNTE